MIGCGGIFCGVYISEKLFPPLNLNGTSLQEKEMFLNNRAIKRYSLKNHHFRNLCSHVVTLIGFVRENKR